MLALFHAHFMKRFFLFGAMSLAFFSAASAQAASTSDIHAGLIKKNAIQTEHFSVEFSDLILQQTDSDSDGLSDIVEDALVASEESYEGIVESLDYPVPPEEDILVLLDDNAEYLLDNSIGTTGYLANGDLYVAIDPWLTPEYLQITIGHELFHYIQFHYDPAFSYDYQGVNLGESTAVWMEDELYDDVDDYVNYLPDFFDYTDFSIFSNIIPSDTLFSYGLVIWPRFLSEQYGAGVIQDIWENFASLQETQDYDDGILFDATREAVEEQGDSLPQVFQTFTQWNLDLSDYEEGDLYPNVGTLTGTANGSYVLSDDQFAPAIYGTNYLYFDNPGQKTFEFHVIQPDDLSYAVTLVPVSSGNPDLSKKVSVILDPNELMEEPLSLKNLNSGTDVVAILSPLLDSVERPTNEQTFDEGYLYYYAASFGTSLDLEALLETENPTQETKSGEDEVTQQEVRGEDHLRLSVKDFGADYAILSWNRPSSEDIDSYELRYGTETGHYTKTVSIDHAYTTFATVDGLKVDQKYYFELRALDSDGHKVGDPSPEVTVTPSAPLFTDVSYSDVRFDSISALTDAGVFQGYPDGSFRPAATINRAELLKILVEGQGVSPDAAQFHSCFPDVGSEWFARYVCYAKAQGWIQGYPDGSFRPAQTVNKVEALKMMFEAYSERVEQGTSVSSLKYPDLATDAWYSIYVWKASQLNLLTETPGSSFMGEGGRNRGDMAEELYRYLVQLKLI